MYNVDVYNTTTSYSQYTGQGQPVLASAIS